MHASLMLLLALVLNACGSSVGFMGQTKLFGSSDAEKSEVMPKTTQTLGLSCLEEAEGVHLTAAASDQWIDFEIDPLCPMEEVASRSHAEEKVANIVFTIDITGSMQENIDTVIQNIIAFSQELTVRQWQVNFAAVLFKDQIWKTINFTTAEDLREQLLRWPAEGGGISHPQEAGLMALSRSAELLRDFHSSHAELAAYKNIILYVSDAPAYYRSDVDFSTSGLAAMMQSDLAALWSNFSLYYSVSPQSLSKYKLPSAAQQMKELVVQLEISPKPLAYPLNKEAMMTQFLSEFEVWETNEALQCYIEGLELGVDSQMDQSALSQRQLVRLGSTEMNSLKSFRLNLEAMGQNTQIRLKRCCTTVGDIGVACHQRMESLFNISR